MPFTMTVRCAMCYSRGLLYRTSRQSIRLMQDYAQGLLLACAVLEPRWCYTARVDYFVESLRKLHYTVSKKYFH